MRYEKCITLRRIRSFSDSTDVSHYGNTLNSFLPLRLNVAFTRLIRQLLFNKIDIFLFKQTKLDSKVSASFSTFPLTAEEFETTELPPLIDG